MKRIERLVGPHFPGAMLSGLSHPCGCDQDACQRCWYFNWHYCGDVMRDRQANAEPLRLRPLDVLRMHGQDMPEADVDGLEARRISWRKADEKRKGKRSYKRPSERLDLAA